MSVPEKTLVEVAMPSSPKSNSSVQDWLDFSRIERSPGETALQGTNWPDWFVEHNIPVPLTFEPDHFLRPTIVSEEAFQALHSLSPLTILDQVEWNSDKKVSRKLRVSVPSGKVTDFREFFLDPNDSLTTDIVVDGTRSVPEFRLRHSDETARDYWLAMSRLVDLSHFYALREEVIPDIAIMRPLLGSGWQATNRFAELWKQTQVSRALQQVDPALDLNFQTDQRLKFRIVKPGQLIAEELPTLPSGVPGPRLFTFSFFDPGQLDTELEPDPIDKSRWPKDVLAQYETSGWGAVHEHEIPWLRVPYPIELGTLFSKDAFDTITELSPLTIRSDGPVTLVDPTGNSHDYQRVTYTKPNPLSELVDLDQTVPPLPENVEPNHEFSVRRSTGEKTSIALSLDQLPEQAGIFSVRWLTTLATESFKNAWEASDVAKQINATPGAEGLYFLDYRKQGDSTRTDYRWV